MQGTLSEAYHAPRPIISRLINQAERMFWRKVSRDHSTSGGLGTVNTNLSLTVVITSDADEIREFQVHLLQRTRTDDTIPGIAIHFRYKGILGVHVEAGCSTDSSLYPPLGEKGQVAYASSIMYDIRPSSRRLDFTSCNICIARNPNSMVLIYSISSLLFPVCPITRFLIIQIACPPIG